MKEGKEEMCRGGTVQRGSGRGDSLRHLVLPLALVLLGPGACEFQRQADRPVPLQEDQVQDLTREVEDMLHVSAGYWNAGDLEGFLADYWTSEELTFSGAVGITRGWEAVKQRYLESYWAPGLERDSLRFEEIEVFPLGYDHVLALGRYVLFSPEAGGVETSSGYFSLVLRSMDGEWVIIHDHTSASPPREVTREAES